MEEANKLQRNTCDSCSPRSFLDTSNNLSPNYRDVSTISREREIFLKAILQLLDQRDTAIDANRADRRNHETSSDIIKSGALKKRSGGVSIYIWKEKFIELKYGAFIYEDYVGWGDSHKKKTISLTVHQCQCRAIHTGSTEGNWLFEISQTNGCDRVWLSSSEVERDSWVQAINTAILGSAGDFNMDEDSSIDTSNAKISRNSLLATPHLQQDFMPYRGEIDRYITLKNCLTHASSVEIYRSHLAKTANKLTVPVFYVKDKFGVSDPTIKLKSRHSRSTTPMQNSERLATAASNRALLSAQVWKDLPRDSICVNGDIITGNRGPEAMVGAIVRHVMDQAAKIRQDLAVLGEGKYELKEGDALSCVRDVLLACNRTESGGDSYLCVNSLLANHDLVVVTPWDVSSEPMQISIDIVNSDGNTSSHLRQNSYGSTDTPYDGDHVDHMMEFEINSEVFDDGSDAEDTRSDLNKNDDYDFDNTILDTVSEPDTVNALFVGSAQFPLHSRSAIPNIPMPTVPELEISISRYGREIAGQRSPLGRRANVSRVSSHPPVTERVFDEVKCAEDQLSDGCPLPTLTSSSHPRLQNQRHDSSSSSNGGPKKKPKNYKSSADSPLSHVMTNSVDDHYNNLNMTQSIDISTRARAGSDSFPAFAAPMPGASKRSWRNPRRHFWGNFFGPSKSEEDMKDDDVKVEKEKKIDQEKERKKSLFQIPFSRKVTNNVPVIQPISPSHSNSTSTPADEAPKIMVETPSRRSFVESLADNISSGKNRGKKGIDTSSKAKLFHSTPSMCIRIQVLVKSKYRICAADPQDEQTDTWASVTGSLHQLFFIKSNCNGRPAFSDRLVTVVISDVDRDRSSSKELTKDMHTDRLKSLSVVK